MHRTALLPMLAALAIAACADSPIAPISADPDFAKGKQPKGGGPVMSESWAAPMVSRAPPGAGAGRLGTHVDR